MKRNILASSRKLKRKRLFLKLAVFLLGIFVLMSGLTAFFYWDKFKIQKISVRIEEFSILNINEIEDYISEYLDDRYIGIFPLNNIFLFPKEKIKNDILKDFLRIKDVVIDKNFPRAIFVEIKERKQTALLCYKKEDSLLNGDCTFLDEWGFIFEKSPFFSGILFVKFFDERTGMKLFSVGEQFFDADKFNNLIKFRDMLKSENIYIENIVLKDEGIYNIFTSLGWFILLNEQNEARDTFENFKITFDEKIRDNKKNLEYIDLRFGNKIFYKFK